MHTFHVHFLNHFTLNSDENIQNLVGFIRALVCLVFFIILVYTFFSRQIAMAVSTKLTFAGSPARDGTNVVPMCVGNALRTFVALQRSQAVRPLGTVIPVPAEVLTVSEKPPVVSLTTTKLVWVAGTVIVARAVRVPVKRQPRFLLSAVVT